MTKNQTSFRKGNEYWKLRAKNIGRPSKYDDSFCDLVLAMGEEGLSPAEMAYELNVCQQTLNNWADTHADFFEAFARAKVAAEAFWTRYGMTRLGTKEFQGPTWLKTMQARFRENWTEKKALELTGADGGAIKMQAVQDKMNELDEVVAKALTRDESAGAESDSGSGGARSGDRSPSALVGYSEGQSGSTEH